MEEVGAAGPLTGIPRGFPLLVLLLLLILPPALSGCARSLRPPPTLADLAGEESPDEALSAGAGRERARALAALRSVPEMREAAGLWTRAAAGEGGSIEDLIEAVRARVWLAEHEAAAEARRDQAGLAVATAQHCPRRAGGEDPVCAYWLGAALGVQARERRATALDALPRIEALFLRAAEGAPEMERGAPDRALALLYARAPGWPAGPGDPDRALEHARRAVSLGPGYPPNLLALAEALRETGDARGAREAYDQALGLAAGMQAAGDPDAGGWAAEAKRGLEAAGKAGG